MDSTGLALSTAQTKPMVERGFLWEKILDAEIKSRMEIIPRPLGLSGRVAP